MADDARALAKLIQRYQRMSQDEQRRVLDHLSPPERVALQRHMEPQRDPETMFSKVMAEHIEMLRDGHLPRVTETGREALLDLAAQWETREPDGNARPARQSLAGRIAGSAMGILA
jgi:hypothetical protein